MSFTFVDLLCGIGGFRIGLESLGGKCLFSCEHDPFCQRTYEAWHGEKPHGDINEIEINAIPVHDIMCAGFPCQPFSIAGVPSRNSFWLEHGFEAVDGNVFFRLAEIIGLKRPKVFLLENVKNLRSHDNGKTFRVIEQILRGLNYNLHTQLIDAAGWVPQHRNRLFMVGFDKNIFGETKFSFPFQPPCELRQLREILEPDVDKRYTLSDKLWSYLQRYSLKRVTRGGGFSYTLADLDGVSNTLTARYGKDGSEILIPQEGKNPRRLTPRECLRLQGFDDSLKIVVSDLQMYHQCGNAVVPAIIESIGYRIDKTLMMQTGVQRQEAVA